jgi:hypothetical protein
MKKVPTTGQIGTDTGLTVLSWRCLANFLAVVISGVIHAIHERNPFHQGQGLKHSSDHQASNKYCSTSIGVELEYLWDRLVPRGVLIIDDLCTWNGFRIAITGFFGHKLGLDAVEFAESR